MQSIGCLEIKSIQIKVGHPHQVIGTAVLFVVVLEHDAGITEHIRKEGIGYKTIDLFLHQFTIRHYSDCAVRSYLVELAFFSCVAHPAVIRDFCISIRSDAIQTYYDNGIGF